MKRTAASPSPIGTATVLPAQAAEITHYRRISEDYGNQCMAEAGCNGDVKCLRHHLRRRTGRAHCLGALYAAAGRELPTLDDKCYAGTGIGVHTPIKGRHLAIDNTLLTAVRALGERANAELKERWKCLRRIRLCPSTISDIVVAAIVLSTLQRGNY